MTERIAHPDGTMLEIARLAGQEPTFLPRGVCHAVANFISSAELQMSKPQRRSLWALIPQLQNSANPHLHRARTIFFADTAMRRYATAALRAAGNPTAAAILRDEPDLGVAAALARTIATDMDASVPLTPASRAHHSTLLAVRAVRAAAKAAEHLRSEDPSVHQLAADQAAFAMSAWAQVTRSDAPAETIALITQVLAVNLNTPRPHPHGL